MGKCNYLYIYFLAIFLAGCNSDEHKSRILNYADILSKSPDLEIEVLKCDKPWENQVNFPTILTLPDKYVMYYSSYNTNNEGHGKCTCYAESIDGINWIKPNLGIKEFGGNYDNNIISYDFENVSVEYANGFFYMLVYTVECKIYLCESEDGKVFEKVNAFKIPYCCDTQNQILYDSMKDTYKMYLRSWYKSANQNIEYNHTDAFYRAISYLECKNIESVDLQISENPLWRWGEFSGIPPALSVELPVIMQNMSNDDYDIYNACVHRYEDGTFLAYPNLYWHLPEPPQGGEFYNDGYTRLGLYYSVDGENFCFLTNDYFHLAKNEFFEFALGHIETDMELIHYYVTFSNTHGVDSMLDSKSKIIARIHNK